MKRFLLLSLVIFNLIFLGMGSYPRVAFAAGNVKSASASIKYAVVDKSKTEIDPRINQLKSYLESHNSPLTDSAVTFIVVADAYSLPDWKLVPAIAGVESTFGKAIPVNSYNPFGWANGTYNFADWNEAITIVTKALKEKYIDRGLDTPEKMSPVYAPPSSTWAGKVRYFMRQIDAFTPERDIHLSLTL